MKEQHSYDWAAYYKAAYKKEVQQNSILAGKLAEAEAGAADLNLNIERIQNHSAWKMYAYASRGYHAFRRRVSTLIKGEPDTAEETTPVILPEEETEKRASSAAMQYQQERFCQKHPYLQMITQWGESQEQGIKVNGFWRYDIPESDLCIIACGYGIIDNNCEKEIKSWFDKNKDTVFAYADEDYYWKNLGNRMHPWFKPEYSPDTLLAYCYIGHMIAVRKSAAEYVFGQMGFPADAETAYADFYEFCLRLEEYAVPDRQSDWQTVHIEKVLFHNCYELSEQGRNTVERAEQDEKDVLETVEKLLEQELEQGYGLESAGSAFLNVREAALKRRGIKAHFEKGLWKDVFDVVYDFDKPDEIHEKEEIDYPKISVVIPSKDHPEVVRQCLLSFYEKTEYAMERCEFIIVDNGSESVNREKMEQMQTEYGFVYLYQPMEFNFSAMCNLGAARAKGEYILLLNDDIEIIQKDWLRIMVGQAMQPHVGAVGAKLWYAGGESIQHAGITNLDIGPSHKLITFPDDRNYYYGHNQVTYDMIGVTAACLLVKKEKYEEVGGLDESMKVAYNDVDFCFKMIEAGYFNVLRNDAVLYHHESLSRGLDEEDDGKWDRLLREKENLYRKHPKMKNRDIFYHEKLIDNASNYTCNFKFDYESNLKETKFCAENAGQLAETCQNVMQLTVDRAEKQHKIHQEEPDIMHIMGWSYLPGADNAKVERYLVLQQEEGSFCKVKPFPWSRKDVEAILPHENNISLAGFVVRIRKENLQNGIWNIGMLAIDWQTGKKYLTWSDKKLVV